MPSSARRRSRRRPAGGAPWGWRRRSSALGIAVSAVQWVPSKNLLDRSPRAGGLTLEAAHLRVVEPRAAADAGRPRDLRHPRPRHRLDGRLLPVSRDERLRRPDRHGPGGRRGGGLPRPLGRVLDGDGAARRAPDARAVHVPVRLHEPRPDHGQLADPGAVRPVGRPGRRRAGGGGRRPAGEARGGRPPAGPGRRDRARRRLDSDRDLRLLARVDRRSAAGRRPGTSSTSAGSAARWRSPACGRSSW